ncbi:MAG: DNA translocase FtsK 4TM domain-containing protein [candidate division WOR-3 bacterium]
MAILEIILALIIIGAVIYALYYAAQRAGSEKKRKVIGLLLILLSILMTLSLLSYYKDQPEKNRGGLFGYGISSFLFWLIGYYSIAVPVLILIHGIYITFFEKDPKELFGILFFVVIVPIFNAFISFLNLPHIRDIIPGGLIGSVLKDFLSKTFGDAGAIILLIFIFGTVLLLFTRLTFSFKKPVPEIVIKRPPEIEPKPKKEKVVKPKPKPVVEVIPLETDTDFKTQFLNLLHDPTPGPAALEEAELKKGADLLIKRLEEFEVTGKITDIVSGPVITRFEFEPSPGIKVNKIANLEDDLALALKATRIRILAPIPGKSAVGIEIPNPERGLVYLKKCLATQEFEEMASPLSIALGEDITGKPVYADIATMPHMLVAGTTGSGKSVCINTIIMSLIYRSGFDKVRFLMIDPKRLELPAYNPIPHILRSCVVDPKEAVSELTKMVDIMENRYREFARVGVRDIDGYNVKARKEGFPEKPYLLIIVDELADLILTAPTEIEERITRLAQMSRAVGIHLILATQRPSVDVITGLIKANFPCRIAFQVASKTDSRTILDMNGAESLLGRGDMLYLPPGRGEPQRLHGAFVSTDEVMNIRNLVAQLYLTKLFRDGDNLSRFIKEILEQELWSVFCERGAGFEEKKEILLGLAPDELKPKIEEIIENGYYPKLEEMKTAEEEEKEEEFTTEIDPLFEEAARLVFRHRLASVSLLQRRLNIGYARAGRIIDQMERAGIIEPFAGSKSRKVLIEDESELDRLIEKITG